MGDHSCMLNLISLLGVCCYYMVTGHRGIKQFKANHNNISMLYKLKNNIIKQLGIRQINFLCHNSPEDCLFSPP